MKKVVMFEEGDYNSALHSLNAAKDVLKRMSQTKNARRLAYYIDEAIRFLTEEDPSVHDMEKRIAAVESPIYD